MEKPYKVKMPTVADIAKHAEAERSRYRLTADEFASLKRLMIALQIFKNEHDLDKRLAKIPRGKLLWGQARAAADKLVDMITETIPTVQLATLQKNLNEVKYQIGIPRPNAPHKDNFGIWVSQNWLSVVGEAAKEKCLTCECDVQQSRSCPLARALDEIPNLKDDNSRGCGYMGLL